MVRRHTVLHRVTVVVPTRNKHDNFDAARLEVCRHLQHKQNDRCGPHKSKAKPFLCAPNTRPPTALNASAQLNLALTGQLEIDGSLQCSPFFVGMVLDGLHQSPVTDADMAGVTDMFTPRTSAARFPKFVCNSSVKD